MEKILVTLSAQFLIDVEDMDEVDDYEKQIDNLVQVITEDTAPDGVKCLGVDLISDEIYDAEE